MSNFKYTALDKSGKEVKASVEAEDKQSAIEQLKSQGLSPVKVDEEGLFDKDLSFNFGGKKKVKPRDLSVFCRQFVSITGAGVAIVDALDWVDDETSVYYNIETGETIMYNENWDNEDVDIDETDRSIPRYYD